MWHSTSPCMKRVDVLTYTLRSSSWALDFHSTKTSSLNFRQLPGANGRSFSKFPKTGQARESYLNFGKYSSRKFSFRFNFVAGKSRILSWMVRISEIQQFPESLGTFPDIFCTICRFSKFSKVLVEWKATVRRERPLRATVCSSIEHAGPRDAYVKT